MEWADVIRELKGGAPAVSPAVLELDLSRFDKAPGPPVIALGISALSDATDARTFGELLNHPQTDQHLHALLPRGERRAFLRLLPNVVRRLVGGAPGPTAVVEARAHARTVLDPEVMPKGGAELESWAQHFGLTELLARLVQLRVGTRAPSAHLSLRECADLVRHADAGREIGASREDLRRLAEGRLVPEAKKNAILVAKRAAFLARQRTPDDPWVAERVVQLRQLAGTRASAGAGSVPLALAYPAAAADFRPGPPRLNVRLYEQRNEHTVDLASGTFTNTGFNWHGSPERLREDRAILECAADVLSDPESTALADLLAWRSIPSWRHMLGAFEEAVAVTRTMTAPLEDDERVAFRLSIAAGGVPAILLQRARKGGAFTVGRLADAHEALSLPNLTPTEREASETIALLGPINLHGRGHLRTRLRLLDLLADHPRVYLEGGPKTPVALRRARATLRVTPAESRFRVDVRVGSAILTAAEALARARTTHVLCAADAAGQTVYFAEVDEVSMALFAALASDGESLPGEGLDATLAVLSSFSDLGLDLDLPEAARGKSVAADPRVVVQLSLAPNGALALALRIRPLAGGPAVRPGAPPRHMYGASADRARIFVTRDLDDEQMRAESLLASLPLAAAVRQGPFDLLVDDPERACDVVATLSELGEGILTEWPDGQRMRVATTILPRALKLRVERKRDWFGIEGGAEVDGTNVGIHTLLEAVRAGRRFVRLGDGALAAISRELRARLQRADDVLQGGREGTVAHAPAVSAVCELVDSESEQIAADVAWLDLRARIRRAQTADPELPAGLAAELRPYQEQGYRWLMRLAEWGAGACLADDMGLGKTLQALAVLEARKAEGPAIVVAPMSVCANWATEAARFAPGLDVLAYRGADRSRMLSQLRPGTVLVTSYDLMLRDIDALSSLEFSAVIFDEAHVLKNGNSKRAAAARRIRAAFRVALSGTPVENHTGELWSLFRVVVPGLFGSWERFRERFAGPIERDRDPGRRAALAATIRPYLLRRTKRDVAPELPPRTEIVRFVDLSAAERDLYEAERLRAIDALKAGAGGEEGRFAILAALTRLRQLACHPRLRHPESSVVSSKLESVLALIDELREAGHRALVFSQFTSHLGVLAEALRPRGATLFELDGSTPADVRADRVRRFQAGEADLFLISLKAGGVGLNLTAADYVLHLDPWWNPAAEDQASDRAHRIGQDKPVTVVRFISRATIEESVFALHAEKRELAEAILGGGDAAAGLTATELFALMEKSTASDSGDGEGADARGDPEDR